MTDPERIEALLDLIHPGRSPEVSRGPELAVLGLAVLDRRKMAYRPSVAGWVLMGARGRSFQPIAL